MVSKQYVDPKVTEQKYHEQLDNFFELHYTNMRRKGIFLIRDECPVCEFLFLAPGVFPAMALFSVRIDYSNFDAAPPSVVFINPLNGNRINQESDLPLKFNQRNRVTKQVQSILVQIGDKPLFICHPGTLEYHEHPFHNGNYWFLNKERGELYALLEMLYSHSVQLIDSYKVEADSQSIKDIFISQKEPR